MIEIDNVTPLPVTFKPPVDGEGPHLVRTDAACSHWGPMVVDKSLATVECGICHERLDPMFVLGQLANAEAWRKRKREEAEAFYERLEERSRTKCQHCQKMTRISRS